MLNLNDVIRSSCNENNLTYTFMNQDKKKNYAQNLNHNCYVIAKKTSFFKNMDVMSQ